MPNHCENNFVITGPKEVIKEIACSHFGKGDSDENAETFNCNSVVPMPESMHITSGGHTSIFAAFVNKFPDIADILEKDTSRMNECKTNLLIDGDTRLIEYLDQYKDQGKMATAIDEGRKFIHNTKKYGYADWYGWTRAMWGTKWGAYDGIMTHEPGELHFGFQSAWSPPTPVIIELAALYPEVNIRHAFLDEGYGFGGIEWYEDGELTNIDNPDDTTAFAQEEFGHEPYEEEEEDD